MQSNECATVEIESLIHIHPRIAVKAIGKKMTTKSISKEELLKVFGSSGLSDKTNKQKINKDDLLIQENYRKSNHSLIIKNHQLKAEIVLGRKQIDQLRAENEQLRERVRILENGEYDEKIEMLISERLEKKLAQLDHIGSRTVQYLLKSAEDFRDVLRSMGVDTTPTDRRNHVMRRPGILSTIGKPLLGAIEESPLRFPICNKQGSSGYHDIIKESEIPEDFAAKCRSMVPREGTPKFTLVNGKHTVEKRLIFMS
uniref:RNA_pol_A_CTD domain-containing protein n=1 Tax=Heterorhabditis bacteriophora TaxID=37862 RepID=A0A1I7XAZ4_HETBA